MRFTNASIKSLAFTASVGTSKFLTRPSTIIQPQIETSTTVQAATSGLPQDASGTAFASLDKGLHHRANDGMIIGPFQTTDLVRPAATSSTSEPTPTSESTSLKWNEAGKWGVLGIASAFIIPLAGWIIRLMYTRYRNRARRQQDDAHQHAQVVAHHGQIAPVQDAGTQAARQDWIDEARLPLDAHPVGLLPTDQELQPLNQYPDAPQIPPQDFGDDFVLNKWLRRMPLARLPASRPVTPPV